MAILIGSNVTTNYTTTSNYYGSGDEAYYDNYTAGASGNATALYLYMYDLDGQSVKLCLWNSSGTLLASTAAVSSGSPGWITGAISSTAVSSGQTYYLGFVVGGGVRAYGDPSTGYDIGVQGNSFATPTNITSPDPTTAASQTFLMYAESSSGSATVPRMNLLGAG